MNFARVASNAAEARDAGGGTLEPKRGGGKIGDVASQGRKFEATAPSLKEGGP